MSASSSLLRLPLSISFLAAVVTALAAGCGGRADEPTTGSGTSASQAAGQGGSGQGAAKQGTSTDGGASKECAGKACGVDCTPAGSDEPFNCDSAGSCVATGQALGCAKTCAPFVGDCIKGEEPADLDGDGCIDGCKPKACPPFLGDCREGEEPADLDGDGCTDGCKPIGTK